MPIAMPQLSQKYKKKGKNVTNIESQKQIIQLTNKKFNSSYVYKKKWTPYKFSEEK